MYNSLRRRGGSKRPAATHARQGPADSHEGSYRDLLGRHASECAEAARGTSRERTEFASRLLGRTADSRNLRLAIDHLIREGGNAPGPNGLQLADLDGPERWSLARAYGEAIRAGTYRPGPHRITTIPKTSGRGTRTLAIQDVEDRVVQRGIVQILQPFIDPMFSETSYGYRPGRAREHALAAVETLARSSGRWHWVLEDVKDAFDQVPHRRLLDSLERLTPSSGFLTLIETVIRDDTGMGLRQGGSLSPLLLNVYLDGHLDRPWKKAHPDVPLVRVADDLLLLCQDRAQSLLTRDALVRRLRSAGMPLRGTPETSIANLAAGEPANWLGYSLTRGKDGLEPRPAESAWRSLEGHLRRTHEGPDAPIHAVETIHGWVDQLGPCYPYCDAPRVHARIASIARTFAFEEIPSRHDVRARWERAHERWDGIRPDDDVGHGREE